MAEIFSSNYIARGKKSINGLVTIARKNGDQRLVIINEEKKSNNLHIIEINELGEWRWIEEKIEIISDEE